MAGDARPDLVMLDDIEFQSTPAMNGG